MARTPWSPAAPALAEAARVVDAVVTAGRSADEALEGAGPREARPAVRAIALGTVRWYLRLMPALDALLVRPRGVAAPVRSLLACAAHQIEYSRNAPEPTVNAAVDAVRLLGHGGAASLTNAVLRRFAAERRALLERLDRSPVNRTAHPRWLIARLESEWPGKALQVLDANNRHPPMTLRVDLSRRSAETYLAELRGAGIDAYGIQWIPSAVTLERPRSTEGLPGFAEGFVSVQDSGAQLAAGLLDARPGMRVLDACAAPGGKTGHVLESAAGVLELTALDVSEERVALIRENLERLGRAAHLVVGRLEEPQSFWDGRPYDRILVDAPCSSTGVIRRHPDIKLLRRSTDIASFAATQLELLRSATALLAPLGRLLYSTCSVLQEENDGVIARLLAEAPALRPVALSPALAPGALARPFGVQLLPGAEAGTDGFYYACLEKTTAGP